MKKIMTRSTDKNNGDKSGNHTSPIHTEDPFDCIDDENPTIKDVMKVLKCMVKSLNFLSDGYEDFKTKIVKLEDENEKLKMDAEQLHKRLQNMENDHYHEQQQKVQNYVTLHGIPLQKNEDIPSTMVKIAEILNVNLTPSSIKSFRSMNNQNKNNATPIIIIEFQDQITKTNIKKNYKDNGPIIVSQVLKNTINTNDEHRKVYINDYLCTYFKQLLEKTKKIQTKCNIKYVWSRNGNVYARYNEKTPIIKIKNYSDIIELEEEIKN